VFVAATLRYIARTDKTWMHVVEKLGLGGISVVQCPHFLANNLIGGIQAEIGSRAVEADINTVSGLLRLRQREGVILSILLKARVNAA